MVAKKDAGAEMLDTWCGTALAKQLPEVCIAVSTALMEQAGTGHGQQSVRLLRESSKVKRRTTA